MDADAVLFFRAGFVGWMADSELEVKLESIIAKAQLVQDIFEKNKKESRAQWTHDAFKNGAPAAHR